MNNRDRCLKIIDNFSDEQLEAVAILLESVKTLSENVADDAYCLRLYTDYLKDTDKDNTIPLGDFARTLGIDLS